jgi:hypothetical protein
MLFSDNFDARAEIGYGYGSHFTGVTMDFLHSLHGEGLERPHQVGRLRHFVCDYLCRNRSLGGFLFARRFAALCRGNAGRGLSRHAQHRFDDSVAVHRGISRRPDGYLIGRKVGTPLFNRPNSRLFKREHLERTQAFYDKHGPKTIVLARFVPIVRTFAPTIAGVANMRYSTFVMFNVLGGIGWITSMCLVGYFLGNMPIVKENFEKAVIGIVLLSIMPMVIHFIQERRHKSDAAAAVETVAPGLEVDETPTR